MKNKLSSFVIADYSKCTGCRACEVACFTTHNKKSNSVSYTIGTVEIPIIPRLYLVKDDEICMPIQCRQCEYAPCAKACPHNAFTKEGNSMVVNDTEKGQLINLNSIPNNKLFCIEKW